ncbi:MAG TPA: hypothetical protein VGG79_13130, partial [Roseiarcus sp.]
MAVQTATNPTARPDPTAGFVIGALIGIIPAALFLALLFALFEIAANTRETNRLLRGILGPERR